MIAIFPELATCAARGDVEKLAVLARRYFGAGDGRAPKLDVHGLLEDAGLKVKRIPFDPAGALVGRDEGGAFTVAVIVSERLDEDQERFLLAHALGHYLFDVQPPLSRGEWQASGFRETLCPLKRYVQGVSTAGTPGVFDPEDRADRFAGALLMPLGMVRRAMERLGDADAAAKVFGVSAPCLRRRLLDIEWDVAPAPSSFLDAEQRLGGGAPAPVVPETLETTETVSAVALDTPPPRSFAASTYAQAERLARQEELGALATAKTPARSAPPTKSGKVSARGAKTDGAAPEAPAKKKAPAADPAAPTAGQGTGVGMERLREIARKLDKGGASKAPARGKERPRSR